MAKGKSKAAGSSGNQTAASAQNRSNDAVINSIVALYKNGDINGAADAVNNSIETAGYFMLEKDGNVTIYGKPYNDRFYDITTKRTFDSVNMSDIIAKSDGEWSTHRYDGQVQFPARILGSGHVGFENAIEVEKAPTGAQMKKLLTTPDGRHDVYQIADHRNTMFEFIALKRK